MIKFDKSKIEQLKDYLYNSNVHDSKIKNIKYLTGQDIKISVKTLDFDDIINIIFYNVEFAILIGKNQCTNNDSISSITVEDISLSQDFIQINNKRENDNIYLVFQMLSGAELHIISKEVGWNTGNTGDGSLS